MILLAFFCSSCRCRSHDLFHLVADQFRMAVFTFFTRPVLIEISPGHAAGSIRIDRDSLQARLCISNCRLIIAVLGGVGSCDLLPVIIV